MSFPRGKVGQNCALFFSLCFYLTVVSKKKFSYVEHFLYGFGLLLLQNAESVARRCSTKQVFLKLLQNSQENTCVGVSLLVKFQPGGLQQKETGTDVFLWILQKVLRTPILQNICEQLLLETETSRVTIRSGACQKFDSLIVRKSWYFGNSKYLQQKKSEIMLIFVYCIKLDENKVSDRTFIRGYTETLSYSNFLIFWS